MKSGNMFSLAEAALKMAAVANDITLTMEGIISELCWLVKDRAQEAIGSYKYGWTQLAESTLAQISQHAVC